MAKTHGQQIKLTKQIGRELGCKDKDSKAMYVFVRRCIWAGFIRAKTMPDACYVDLHSLFSFLKKIEHPGFWTPERRKRYNDARDSRPDADDSWPPKEA